MKKFVMTALVATAMIAGAQVADAFVYAGGLIKVGSTGSQVMDLQTCLADMGVNSYDNIDGIFGSKTKAAVMAFQASKDVAVDGIIGPITGPLYTAACAADMDDEDMDDEDMDADEDDFDVTDGEEADFEDFDVDDADDDTLEEGADEAEIAEYVFELDEGGAVLLERFDVVLDFTGTDDGDELDAWEAFNTIYLMVDGDVIAEMDADDEDDWKDTTAGGDDSRLRFTGVNHVFDADEEHTIVVAADVAGSLDLGTDNESEWTIFAESNSLRFVDEAGITLYLTEEAGAPVESAIFTIEEEGQDDELDVQSSNDDPDSTTLKVEDDEASDDYTVFVFELEADDKSSDIELDHVQVTVATVGTNGGGATTYDNIVKDAKLMIDGVEFDDFSYTDAATVVLDFDIDKDFTVDSGETVDVELVLEFASANGTNYNPGATVMASVAASAVTGEGAEDLTAGGTATGDIHTLLVEGINAEVTGSPVSNVVVVDGDDNDYAEFEIVLDVEAFENDAFISQFAATSITYSIIDAADGLVAHSEAGTGTVATGNAVISISSSADLEGDYFRINENDSETVTVTLSYTPANVGVASGSYRLQLDSIEFAATAVAPTESYLTIPSEDFNTGNANVTN